MSTEENPFDTGTDNPGMDETGEHMEMGNLNPYDSSSRLGSYNIITSRYSRTHGETPFGGDISETTSLLSQMESTKDAWERIIRKFPIVNPTNSPFTASVDKYDQVMVRLNPRSLLEKIVTRSLEGGDQSDPPSTFDTIHLIDLKFGTYNKLRLYFQLSETTWCLIGFHGNNSQINDVTGGRHLGFSNFQILFKFSLLYRRLTGKQLKSTK